MSNRRADTWLKVAVPFALALALGCGDDSGSDDGDLQMCIGGAFCPAGMICVMGYCLYGGGTEGPGEGEGEGDGDGDGDSMGDGDGDAMGDGDGDSMGDGDGDSSCEVPKAAALPVIPQVMFVLDRSGSMSILWDHDNNPGTPDVSRWSSVHGALTAAIGSFDARVDFGAMLFPSTSATSVYSANACLVSMTPEVPVHANGQAVLDGIPSPASRRPAPLQPRPRSRPRPSTSNHSLGPGPRLSCCSSTGRRIAVQRP